MLFKKSLLSCFAVSVLCSSTSAVAEEWQAGIAVLQTSGEYKGKSAKTLITPFIFYQDQDWSFKGTALKLHLHQGDNSLVYAGLAPRFQGFDDDFSRFTKGMKKREHALEASVGVDYVTSIGVLGAKFAHDISETHEGSEIQLSYALPFEVDNWQLTPSLFARHFNDSYVDYYYGIRKSEVIHGRPFYQAEAATNVGASIDIGYFLDHDFRIGLQATTELLHDNIRNSPLIDKRANTYLAASVLVIF